MQADLEFPHDVDVRMGWPPGTARRLAKRGTLPHYRLPDGSIRLRWAEVSKLIHPVPASPTHTKGVPGV
jgi:hypothetical protein